MKESMLNRVDQALTLFTRPRRRQASKEEVEAVDAARRVEVQYRDIKLAAWEWGAGPAVLLLHGWESRASHMSAFASDLVRKGFRALALDAPAHGESEGETTDVVDFGRAVAFLASQIGPFSAVVAHSVGSAAALFAFANGMDVKASVHLCGPTSLTRVLKRGADMLQFNEEEAEELKRRMSEHLGHSTDRMDLVNLKAGMKHPAFILHDANDLEVPVEESKELTAAWPGSTLYILEGIGHRRIIKDPYVISRTVEFIERALSHSVA